MSEIFREVDEEVRHEQLLKLWRSYGKYVAAVITAVAIGWAGSAGWKKYQLSQRLDESAQFSAAVELMDQGNSVLAAQRFADLADDADSGYAVLARLREAEAWAAAGDPKAATAALDRLAVDDRAEPSLRELAGLLAVLNVIDSEAPDALERRLEPLLKDGSAWRASARELGGLIAYRRGETARAREIFTGLSEDASTPPGMRRRAAEILALLGGRVGG